MPFSNIVTPVSGRRVCHPTFIHVLVIFLGFKDQEDNTFLGILICTKINSGGRSVQIDPLSKNNNKKTKLCERAFQCFQCVILIHIYDWLIITDSLKNQKHFNVAAV